MQLILAYGGPKKSPRQTQKDRVLMMLRSNDWVTNTDFCRAFIPNFRSRISELRKEGYQISEGERIKESVWRYRLEPDESPFISR